MLQGLIEESTCAAMAPVTRRARITHATVVTRVGLAPLGGDLEAKGLASADSWPKALGFLRGSLE